MDKEEAYTHYKTLGNEAFKNKNFPLAIDEYTKAIEILEDESQGDINVITENVEDVRKHSHKYASALAILYSNRAQTQLKLENYGLAIHDCTVSIDHDNKFVKSLYRRAIANYAIRELSSALKDCKEAKILAPNDSKIKMLTNEVSNELKRIKFEKAIEMVEKSSFSLINWDELDNADRQLNIEIVNDYDVKITKGLNDDFIKNIIEKFRNGEKMNKFDAFAIVSAANTLLKDEKLLVEVGFKDSKSSNYLKFDDNVKKITVCGDTHGQYFDLLNIFQKFGNVGDDHVYLFNGDFVDRGSWGCEVALLLYSLKVLYPTKIFINRGNHETDDMNLVYGFKDECKVKYGEKLFKCFGESFGNLPLCTLINEEYLVMHGGLFSDDTVTIDTLRNFRKSGGQPSRTGIEMELLWTDPQVEEGRSLSKRGIGMQFGPDITKAFCDKNNIKGIIRSHEVRDKGFEWEHDGKLCTVFSAPNYCDVQGNLGAVINMTRGEDGVELDCCTFEAVEHPNIPPMNYTKNQYGF